MYRAASTPFDRNPNSRPLLRLLLHSQSLGPHVAASDAVTTRLMQLSGYDFLEVLATPTSDASINSLFSQLGVESARVEQREGYWGLYQSHSSTLIGPVQENIDYSEPIVAGSSVTWLDFIMARNLEFDYFVVAHDDPFLHSKTVKTTDLNPDEALDRVRLMAVHSGIFQVIPRHTVNEGFYYLYRFKKLFRSFQRAYSFVVLGPATTPPDARERLDSLAQRLEFICRAADQASFYGLGRATNDNQDRSLYHTAHLISLITGVFEDLAWYLSALYGVAVNKMGVSIRKFADNRANDRFFMAIQSANPQMHRLLTDPMFQARLNLFYPVRNLLHHGVFIQGVRLMGSRDGLRFTIPNDAVELMKHLEGPDYQRIWGVESFVGDQYFVDPHRFVSRSVEVVATVVNDFLDSFDWEALVEQLPQQQAEAVRDSWAAFQLGVARFLNWGADPIYF